MSLARAFVTGGTGFVGSHVVKTLIARGVEVKALVRPQSPLANLDGLKCEIVLGDLGDEASMRPAMLGCDIVFHAAADYRLWARDPRAVYRTNVGGTENVLRAAAHAGVGRLVYTSTVGTLGIPTDGSPGTEDTPVGLVDMVGHYKRSKYIAEQRARELAAEAGLDLVIVHPSTPVGEGDIKPTPTGRIIVDFLNGRMPAYVDTGLNLVDVRDVAEGHVLAATLGQPGRSYVLGCENMSLHSILKILGTIAGLAPPRARLPHAVAYGIAVVSTLVQGTLLRREPRAPIEGARMAMKRMYFSTGRAVRELGLPQSSVRGALERAVAWFSANGYVHSSTSRSHTDTR